MCWGNGGIGGGGGNGGGSGGGGGNCMEGILELREDVGVDERMRGGTQGEGLLGETLT